jgi:non-ribosomal peptide synthetase component E (peptide arylation enzyme)
VLGSIPPIVSFWLSLAAARSHAKLYSIVNSSWSQVGGSRLLRLIATLMKALLYTHIIQVLSPLYIT